MTTPDRLMSPWAATYFDGQSARRHAVTVERTLAGFVIRGDSIDERFWPIEGLRVDESVGSDGPIRLEHGALDAPEVLVVADGSFRSALPDANAGGGAMTSLRRRSLRSLVVPTLAALLGIVVIWQVALPVIAARVAKRVPVEVEERLGSSAVSLLTASSRTCRDDARIAALDMILQRLIADGRGGPYRYQLTIVDDSLVNAFAAPGGRIVIYHGLIAEAESAEEVAGVLAHEIQHVTKQHGLQSILRDMPARLLVSSLIGSNPMGGTVANAAYTLSNLSYARDAERAADREAVGMLIAARIAPQGMIAFFRRAATERSGDARLLNYLSSHPSNAARIAALEEAAALATDTSLPLLSAAEWAALRADCRAP